MSGSVKSKTWQEKCVAFYNFVEKTCPPVPGVSGPQLFFPSFTKICVYDHICSNYLGRMRMRHRSQQREPIIFGPGCYPTSQILGCVALEMWTLACSWEYTFFVKPCSPAVLLSHFHSQVDDSGSTKAAKPTDCSAGPAIRPGGAWYRKICDHRDLWVMVVTAKNVHIGQWFGRGRSRAAHRPTKCVSRQGLQPRNMRFARVVGCQWDAELAGGRVLQFQFTFHS